MKKLLDNGAFKNKLGFKGLVIIYMLSNSALAGGLGY
jgi:hypothetical protein